MSDTDLNQAEARYRTQDYAGAASLLAGLPATATSLRLLGLCRMKQGDLPAALDLLRQAVALAPDDPWGQLHLGVGLQTAGRHAEAAQCFRTSHRGLPQDPAPLVNLASCLLMLGDAVQAVEVAREACVIAPDRFETHYTQGLAWQASGQADRAMAAFKTAVRLAPRFADGWVNLGVCLYHRADIEGAQAAMRRALEAAPGHRGATANLGAFLRLTGESAAAETLLRDLLARDPGAAEARLNLAADLLNEERPAEALHLLDVPLPADPGIRRHWQLQQALALLQLGRADDARRILAAIGDVPPALRAQKLWREVLLAEADGNLSRAHGLAHEMAGALAAAGPAAVPEHRIMACYDLAKFWSKHGDHDRAFGCWARGHTELARFQPFSRQAHRDFVEANIASFSHQRLHGGPRATNRDPAPVFIVGMPRSGTTLTHQILAAHTAVHGAGERSALAQSWARLGGGQHPDGVRRIAGLDPAALDDAALAYLAQLRALAPSAGRVVDKMPGNFLLLGLAGLLLPGARIIHCQRDPRDVGLSIFTFRFHGLHAYAHDLGDLGWYIRQHDRLNAHWRQALPNPILPIRLRDWVEDFDATLARVLAFLDLPEDPRCKQFHLLSDPVRTVSRAQIRQPVNAAGLGRWRTYATHLAPLIAELEKTEQADE